MFEKQYLNEIADAVKQGIVASKESDSKFWGDFQEWRKKKDARDDEMHDTLIKFSIALENLVEAKTVQNGRIAKCEERLSPLENIKVFSLGALKVGGLLIGTILALIVYIFLGVNKNIDTLAQSLQDHAKSLQDHVTQEQ